MKNMDLPGLTIKDALEGFAEKKFSSREIIESIVLRIKKLNPELKVFLSDFYVDAINYSKKENTLLKGLPLVVKDNILTRKFKTTAASKLLSDFQPVYNATVVNKVLDNGGTIIGKTNMDAWAHGSSTETSDFGSTLNPWDTSRLPGGSSGGSAAAVAADLCIFALGTETAGSIRQPASWCGVVGLKPSYGLVSRYGIIAMASSTDSPGPITKTVWDAAFILNIISGNDPYDATSINVSKKDYTKELDHSISGVRIGVPKEYFSDKIDSQVKQTVMSSLKNLEKMGAQLKEISLLDPEYAIATYTIIQRSEVSSNLARYDGVRFGHDRSFFGEEARRRIMLGTYTLSSGYYDAFYRKAEKVRTLIINDFQKAFENVDLIAGPVSPTTALPVGATDGQSMFGEIADMLVEPSSIAGLPGISVPCGFVNNLPVGLGLIGARLSEELILRVAHQYEQSTDWHKRKPKLTL